MLTVLYYIKIFEEQLSLKVVEFLKVRNNLL